MSSFITEFPNQWRSFGTSWNAIVWRFRTMIDSDEAFRESVNKSKTPEPEERYIQERALFEFYASALTILENFCFSLFCVVSIKDNERFSIDARSLQRVTPRYLLSIFRDNYPDTEIFRLLREFIEDSQYSKLKETRDYFLHRGAYSRATHMFLGVDKESATKVPHNPKDIAEDWDFSIEIDTEMTQVKRDWVVNILSRLFDELDNYI